ncbi:MAG: hypothetical protein AB1546_06890 [bacterium]
MKEKIFDFNEYPLFSMCSIYPRTERMICACFLSKDKKTIDLMKRWGISGLMWAGMGAGAISLHDLEQEMKGRRFHQSDGRTDAEYIKECHKAGIKVFTVVFTGQLYEVGIELNKNETKILSYGRHTGKEKSVWWGFREFYNNAYPSVFKGWNHYFSDRKNIGDPLKEVLCRTCDNKFPLTTWTSEPDKYFDCKCYAPCKNSEIWVQYTHKIIEMQIDAGAHGILFDEPSSPYEPIVQGGGFCERCMRKSQDFLLTRYHKKFRLSDLKRKSHNLISSLIDHSTLPYWKELKLFRLHEQKYFLERDAAYARNYAQKKGKKIHITSNFVNLMPNYFPMVKTVDVLNFELDYSFPSKVDQFPFFRIARKLAGDKPVTAVPPIFAAEIYRNRERLGYPTDQMMAYFLCEAAAAGGSFQIPYSCFTLGGKGAYYPCEKTIKSITKYTEFLHNKAHLISPIGTAPVGDTVVILSWLSYFWSEKRANQPGSHFQSFLGACRLLNNLKILYDVSILGDDDIVPSINSEFDRKTVILPHVFSLTDEQMKMFYNFIEEGGRALILGDFAQYDGHLNKFQRHHFKKLKTGINHIGKGLVVNIGWDIGREYRWMRRESDRAEFRRLLAPLKLQQTIELNAPIDTLAALYQKKDRFVLHLLNQQFDIRIGKFHGWKNIKILLNTKRMKKARILFHSPEMDSKPVKIKNENGKFFIPEIKIYGLLEILC